MVPNEMPVALCCRGAAVGGVLRIGRYQKANGPLARLSVARYDEPKVGGQPAPMRMALAGVPFSVARVSPRWVQGPRCPDLNEPYAHGGRTIVACKASSTARVRTT